MLSSLVPKRRGRLSSGAATSKAGSGSPRAKMPSRCSQLARIVLSGGWHSRKTVAPISLIACAYLTNCSVSPKPCSANSMMVLPASESPPHSGAHPCGIAPASTLSLDSYASQPDSNSPDSNRLMPKPARTFGESGSISRARRYAPIDCSSRSASRSEFARL